MSGELQRVPQSDLLRVDRAEVVAALRTSVFSLAAADIEFSATMLATSLWGVVIETGYPDAVASLIALADGSVSLYVSDGTGSVGCGANREVRQAGLELLGAAERRLDLSTPTDDSNYAPPGSVRFYFLCTTGLRSVELRIEDLNTVDSELGSLYFAGQSVINAIERTGAGQSIEQEIRLAQLAQLAHTTPADHPAVGSPVCSSVGNAVRRLQR